jgi:hypothetical protein
MSHPKRLFAFTLTALWLAAALAPSAASAAPRYTGREVFEDFDSLTYLLPGQSGAYWAIPLGDTVQYFGSQCDPETTACILAGSEPGVTFARLQISHDPSPAGYDNADLAGIPTGTTFGSGNQLWCVSHGHPLTMDYRVRWSSDYGLLGLSDVAVGSSGLGAWSNPVLSNGELAPFNAAFFQWVDGTGLSTMVTKVVGDQTAILSFLPVTPLIDMQAWNEFRIEIVPLLVADQVTFYVRIAGLYTPVNTIVVPGGIGCLSMENWNDIQSYDILRNTTLQNLPSGESQYLDIDWYRFSQP